MGILQHIEHQISALNDLVKINNDRITGYQKAAESTSDDDLKRLFLERDFAAVVVKLGGPEIQLEGAETNQGIADFIGHGGRRRASSVPMWTGISG